MTMWILSEEMNRNVRYSSHAASPTSHRPHCDLLQNYKPRRSEDGLMWNKRQISNFTRWRLPEAPFGDSNTLIYLASLALYACTLTLLQCSLVCWLLNYRLNFYLFLTGAGDGILNACSIFWCTQLNAEVNSSVYSLVHGPRPTFSC